MTASHGVITVTCPPCALVTKACEFFKENENLKKTIPKSKNYKLI